MPKFTKAQQSQRIDHAKQLYCKGFDLDTIAAIIQDVSPTTLSKWVIAHDFERAKRSQLIALSQIRNTILESYADMLEGKTPKMLPDAAAKYATAFEKFSSRKQVLMYMYEAFELLTDSYQTDIAQTRKQADKQLLLDELQRLRARMDTVINNLNNEVLGNE